MHLQPTLIIIASDSAATLLAKLPMWFTRDTESAFVLLNAMEGDFDADMLHRQVRGLQRRFPALQSAGLIDQHTVTDIHLLIIGEISAQAKLQETMLLGIAVRDRLRAEGAHTLGLTCRFLLYGSNINESLTHHRVAIAELAQQDAVAVCTLYMNDWRGKVPVTSVDLLKSVEVAAGTLLLLDSKDRKINAFWRDANEQCFALGLEEFRCPDRDAIAGRVLAAAVVREARSFFQGLPITEADKRRTLAESFPGFTSLPDDAGVHSEEQNRRNYDASLATMLMRSAPYAGDLGHLGNLLRELANVVRTSARSQKPLARLPPAAKQESLWRRIVEFISRFLFRLRGKPYRKQDLPISVNRPEIVEPPPVPFLAIFLERFADSFTSIPRDSVAPHLVLRAEQPQPTTSDPLALVFQPNEEQKTELTNLVITRLQHGEVTLPVLLMMEFVNGFNDMQDVARQADQLRRDTLEEVKVRLTQQWLDTSLSTQKSRIDTGEWTQYVFTYNVTPATEIARFLLLSGPSAPGQFDQFHGCFLPPGLFLSFSLVKIS